jgi:hypothetical protein
MARDEPRRNWTLGFYLKVGTGSVRTCRLEAEAPGEDLLPSGEKISSKKLLDDDPIVANTVAVLLTYNTKVGKEDPAVLRWLQEGCKGDTLFQKMMKHDLYRDVFEEFWEFQLALGQKLGFVHTAVCMEWSRHADFAARVHLHAYHAPGLRFRSWDHHTPSIVIRAECLMWKDRRPDCRPC